MIPALQQLTGSGILMVLVGGALAYLRNIPTRLWSGFLRLVTVSLTVKDDDSAFQWIKEWVLEQEFMQKVRRVDLDSTLRGKVLALLPAPGEHYFFHKGRPFLLTLTRSEEKKGAWESKRAETLTLRTFGRRQSFLREMVDQIIRCHKDRTKDISKIFLYEDCWTSVRSYSPRSLEAIILKDREKESLLADVSAFLSSKQRYKELGVPYHRGYLFYGPPGTGKTSLVSAFAAHLGMSIYIFNLSEYRDKSLTSAIHDVPENSVILFEDIDTMQVSKQRVAVMKKGERDRPSGSDSSSMFGVTLSGLLNVLDGFHAPDSVLFVMTTNHIEKLDAALLRPGRIDYKLYMGEAAAAQKVTLYRRFFPTHSQDQATQAVASRPQTETMAEFQGYLLSQSVLGTPEPNL